MYISMVMNGRTYCALKGKKNKEKNKNYANMSRQKKMNPTIRNGV